MTPMGRPTKDDKKDMWFKIRMDEADIKLLDECAEQLRAAKSETVRTALRLLKEHLDGK